MFMQNIMLAARAWTVYPSILREALAVPEHLMVVCGMALGYADPDAAENRVRAPREPVTSFTRFFYALLRLLDGVGK